jgi:hypothetical protein
MPSWEDRLSEQQRWDLVNYLREELRTVRLPGQAGGALSP